MEEEKMICVECKNEYNGILCRQFHLAHYLVSKPITDVSDRWPVEKFKKLLLKIEKEIYEIRK